MAQPIWVGIDISGKWLDVGSHPQQETIRFPYTDAGVADLLSWLAVRAVIGVAMEATGGIERTVAYALADAGHQPRIVNPKRVRDFSKAISPIKNDRIDACRIAHFARRWNGRASTSPQINMVETHSSNGLTRPRSEGHRRATVLKPAPFPIRRP